MIVSNDYRIVLVTTDSIDSAKLISRNLVEAELAACCNIITNIESIYKWHGKIEESKEILIIIKTKQHLIERLEEMILRLHNYDTPEIISIAVDSGNSMYLKWIDEVTKDLS